MIQQAVATKTQRHIFKCQRNTCKHVWAHDYQVREVTTRFELTWEEFYRIEDGQEISYMEDYRARCPKCNCKEIKGIKIHATLDSSHKCDVRCMNAKGKDCSCECGGENHGRSFLV